MSRLLIRSCLVMAAVLPAAAAEAQVSCSNPDNLCTGDPCITRNVEVISPCIADFGTRALVIGGALRVPGGGTLSLSARTVEVRSAVSASHTKPTDPAAGFLTLDADETMVVNAPIKASGFSSAGGITLVAGGSIVLNDRLTATADGGLATAPGGVVAVTAGGSLLSTGTGKVILAHGAATRFTPGGQVVLQATNGVDVPGEINASGSTGGFVSVTSTTDVVLLGRVELRGSAAGTGNGGTVMVGASGAIRSRGKLRVSGKGPGGMVVLTSSGASVEVADVAADGRTAGGDVTVEAATDATVRRAIRVRGKTDGGGVTVTAGGNATVVHGPARFDARGGLVGGRVDVVAGGTATFGTSTRVDVGGRTGGTIHVTAADVAVNDAGFAADGKTVPGAMFFVATAGDMRLSRSFRSRAGTIEGRATGDLTATGQFRAARGGCIALSAGGTLVTAAARFDEPLVADCPGSPSAAFLDPLL